MKTYAQTVGQKKFNWFRALDKAIEKGVTQEEHQNLSELAEKWTTCACGNQCSIIPRDLDGEPCDNKLSNLGIDFSHQINQKRFKSAKNTLIKIEKRSSEIIFKIKKRERLQKFAKEINKEIEKLSKDINDEIL